MKILICTNIDSGLYKFRKELIQELLKEFEVYISLPYGKYVDNLVDMGCHFIDTHVDRRGMNPIKDFKLILKYLNIINQIEPDAILTYTIKPNLYAGFIAKIKKVKTIINITGLGTSIQNGGFISKILTLFYGIVMKNAEVVFFQNADNKAFFENNGVNSNNRLIPGSGVNLDEHNYEPYPKECEVTRLLFIGRIMKDKGIEELLKCAEYFNSNGNMVHFDIVGSYDDKSFEKQINELSKKGVVDYLGYRDDIHELIAAHHAVIHPSYHEGLSNVLLEAAACGRPVLASNIPGCIETFEEGVTGLGFEERDATSMIETVRKFEKIPYEEKILMGINGRKKVQKEFDRKIVINAYKEELSKLLKMRN